MSYPRSLLPKKYFRTFNVDELPNSKNYYLVRRSSCPSTEAFDRLGLLTSKALLGLNSSTKMPDIKQVYGMSMNFLGMFKTRHLIYVAKNNAKKYWTSKTNHQWTYQNDIEVDSHTSPIYFKLFDLHEFQFPYFRQIDKDYKKRIPDKLSAGLSPSSIHACSKVLHKPIMANFWHSEFHVEDLLTGRIFKPSDTCS